jgi:DNA-directed RNA polymerase alpha subunit
VFTAWCHDDRYAGDRTPADREPHERDRVSGWTIDYVWTPVHPGEHGHLELADSPLGARISEALSREQIHTVSDLVSRSPSMLLDIKSMGSRGIERIEEWLSSLGIAWRDSRQGR